MQKQITKANMQKQMSKSKGAKAKNNKQNACICWIVCIAPSPLLVWIKATSNLGGAIAQSYLLEREEWMQTQANPN